jgi:hypothetical protein
MKILEALVMALQMIAALVTFMRKNRIKKDAKEGLEERDQRKIERNHGGTNTDLPSYDGLYKRSRKKSKKNLAD